MNNINVLVFTPQYFPDFGPSAPIYTALCEDLVELGLRVSVITAFPHFAGSDQLQTYPNKFIYTEIINGVKVIRTFVYQVPKNSLWRRLLYHGSYNLFSTWASIGVKEVDIIIADAPTLWSGFPLMVKAILPKIPYIYVIHDIFPDVIYQSGINSNSSILNVMGNVEKFFYHHAAKISVLSQGFKDNIIAKGIEKDKLEIIPACVDVDILKPQKKQNKIREKWGLGDKFVVLYAGNFGFTQGVDRVLDAANMLKEFEDIIFLLVGDGAEKEILQNKIETHDMKNVRLHPFLPQQDIPYLYASSDVCLVSLKKNIIAESVPSKTYTIMACGRPIIATVNNGSEVNKLIEQVGCGISVDPENSHALANAILSLYKNPNMGDEMGRRGRNAVVENYSRKVAADKYNTLIHQSLNGKLSSHS